MRRLTLSLLLLALAACGSGTDSGGGGSSSPYTVSVVNESRNGGSGTDWTDVIQFEVLDKANLIPVSGATVITQVTAGSVATLPLITAANGRVTGTWTIPVADQTAGATHSLAICAPEVGGSICKTRFSADNTVRITF